MCMDGKRCIPKILICDNVTHCDDGSDEANCTLPEENKNVRILLSLERSNTHVQTMEYRFLV